MGGGGIRTVGTAGAVGGAGAVAFASHFGCEVIVFLGSIDLVV